MANNNVNAENCCSGNKKNNSGFLTGLIFGILPHSFCLAFLLFSLIGVVTLTTVFRRFLLIPYFFHVLVGLSLIFATISGLVYLKKCGLLSKEGLAKKWRYLLTLYGTTVGVNLLFFMLVFPMLANVNLNKKSPAILSQRTSSSLVKMSVDIPCPGHAPLITGELKGMKGVNEVQFIYPNVFQVGFDASEVSQEQILNLEIFDTYKASVL